MLLTKKILLTEVRFKFLEHDKRKPEQATNEKKKHCAHNLSKVVKCIDWRGSFECCFCVCVQIRWLFVEFPYKTHKTTECDKNEKKRETKKNCIRASHYQSGVMKESTTRE